VRQQLVRLASTLVLEHALMLRGALYTLGHDGCASRVWSRATAVAGWLDEKARRR
jgi:hypothetical protein